MKTHLIFQFDQLSFPARPECFTECNVVKCIEGLIERKLVKYSFLCYIFLIFFAPLHGMEQEQQKGPMDSIWFYDKSHVFAQANQYHQEQQWKKATEEYTRYLTGIEFGNMMANICGLHYQIYGPSEYDRNKAYLNLAACLMAQRKASNYWKSFDVLLNIPLSQRISSSLINDHQKPLKDQVVLVRTDQIGLGDVFCFLSAAHELKKRTECHIILSVPYILKGASISAAQKYGFKLITAIDKPTITIPYETHLIALLGHLHLTPSQMNPKKVVFTAPERAINAILEQIEPVLEQGNILVVADRGEVGRQTNPALIGGKQLPHNSDDHGRHLDSEPFNALLKNSSTITLLDCSNKNNRITIDEKHKNRYLIVAPEEQPFDTIIALGRIMSTKKNIIAFGPDMGQTNVFMRSLDHDAQDRMAFIIPNAQEHDMRMEGEGSKYKHMISNCWVYKCATPQNQTQVIEQAYNDMLRYTLKNTNNEKK